MKCRNFDGERCKANQNRSTHPLKGTFNFTPKPRGLAAKNICVQEFIAEFALGVVGLAQFNEGRQLFVNGFQFCGRRGE